MTALLWSGGHIGWATFALVVFSVAWLLATDLAWRLARTRFRNLAFPAGGAWLLGAGLIVLVAVLSGR